MANKDFVLDEGLAVTVYKRRGNRNLRLSIGQGGKVRVTIPAWAPYSAGAEFARARRQWILEHTQPESPLIHGQAVGKAHHLEFIAKAGLTKTAGRVHNSLVVVQHPLTAEPHFSEVQKAAHDGCVRALRTQAEQLLPQRLEALASAHDFTYKSLKIKRLKSRWGSCDQDGNIVLNLFLMQLPWELIDYVLVHELVHTGILRHGPDFWQAMAKILPDVRQLRKSMRNYQPALNFIR